MGPTPVSMVLTAEQEPLPGPFAGNTLLALVDCLDALQATIPHRSRSVLHRCIQHAKRLKTLRGLTPHEFVCAQWQKNPAIFTQDPTHLTLGLYITSRPPDKPGEMARQQAVGPASAAATGPCQPRRGQAHKEVDNPGLARAQGAEFHAAGSLKGNLLPCPGWVACRRFPNG
jgi:hypothetical protein